MVSDKKTFLDTLKQRYKTLKTDDEKNEENQQINQLTNSLQNDTRITHDN